MEDDIKILDIARNEQYILSNVCRSTLENFGKMEDDPMEDNLSGR